MLEMLKNKKIFNFHCQLVTIKSKYNINNSMMLWKIKTANLKDIKI